MLVRRRGIAVKSELVRVRDFMEEQPQTTNKVYRHYAHSDSCNPSRWTARESYEYMYARPWHRVNDFYSDLVNGRSSLSELFGAENGVEPFAASIERQTGTSPPDEQIGRWARVTFKIVLSYHGESFDGWQRQPGLNTVQGLVEKSLGKFVDDKKAQQIKEKGLPIEGIAVVAGRTDKGVTALNQVCSFYTWRKDIRAQDIECAVNAAAPRKLRVLSVTQVSRVFHPNFSAKWRRYLYILPFSEGDDREESNHENLEDLERVKKPTSFSITRVDQLLRHLEGKLLSYKMFARDTKASRNIGPPTECFLYHARAAEARLPCSKEVPADAVKVMCVELVANRFLRKMVRVLVATAIREAAAGAEDEIMLKLMEATCRRATAPPAPPDGLCLVDVGYADFVSEICCIA